MEADFWKAYQDQGVVVVGIDLGETAEKVAEWKASKKITYPIFLDAEEKTFPLFGQAGIPTNVILDSERQLRFVEAGFKPEDMNKVLDELVE